MYNTPKIYIIHTFESSGTNNEKIMQKFNVYAAIGIACLLLLTTATAVFAKPGASVKSSTSREENPRGSENTLLLPYAFPSDSLGTVLGFGGMVKGYGQDQLMIGGTALASTDAAYIGILTLRDYQMPVVERLFFSAIGSLGRYPVQRAYVNGDRPAGDVYAGSNESDKKDFFVDSGSDNWFDFKLEYVLPMGHGADGPLQEYKLRGGILQSGASGGDTWNLMKSGVTVLMLKQFNRYQSMDLPIGKKDYSVHPLQAAIFYNNSDFPINPSKGSTQYFAYTRDFGWAESENQWDFIEFEATKYFALCTNDYTKHQTIALNFWTGHSPSATVYTDVEGNRQVADSPPFTQGAKLGGLYRMRAYPSNRFNDNSVLYASAEYRWTPEWNPMGRISWSWLRWLKMDWMQFVPFIEIGRVAEEYDLYELFSDMKVDGGISLRAMMSGAVVRFDIAFSEEQSAATVMFGHPF